MFGFLYAPSPGCGTAMRSAYQRTFCGLACKLHADYSAAARFLINRDSTFLAMAGSSLGSESLAVTERTCCNPLAHPREVSADGNILGYAGAVTVSGLMVKLDDNATDEKGLKKTASRALAGMLRPARDRAIGTLNSSGFPTQDVLSSLAQQDTLERQQANFIESSEPTATAYGKIFGHLGKLRGVLDPVADLYQLGSSLGRLIYWKDALDDLKQDEKYNRFNPLRYHSKEDLTPLIEEEFTKLKIAVSAVPWQRDGDTIHSVIDHSLAHHRSMIGKGAPTGQNNKNKEHWWNTCCDCCPDIDCCPDCCDSGSSADSSGCCDCGSCDCSCCPCD